MNCKFVVLAILALTSSAGATCDHPYFPAALGMSWTYTGGAGGIKFDSTTRVVSIDAQNYFSETLSGTISSRAKVQCQSDGSLVIATNSSLFDQGLSEKSESVLLSGVSIPAPQYWVVGNQWKYTSTEKSVRDYSGARTVEMTVTQTVNSKIVGSEVISVPAGKFTTLKVTRTFDLNRTVMKNGSRTISKETTTNTVWFARGIGAVKFSGKNYTILLTKFVKP